MTRTLRSLSCTALAALATLGGCRGDSTEPDDLRLSISVDRAFVARSDSVQVSLTLTNTGVAVMRVLPSDAYGICLRAFEVFDRFQRPLVLEQGLCIAALIVYPNPVDLAPGASMSITDYWRPGGSRYLDGQPIPSGTFALRGRVAADNDAIRSGFRQVSVVP